MRFDMEVQFDSGVMTGDGSDPDALIQIAELLVARAEGRDNDTIGIEGGRTKFVGDVRSIRIEAAF